MRERVIYRMWRNGYGVIALLPDQPSGPYIGSYEHIGQHGKACYDTILSRTRAAAPDEYRDLHAELLARGYDLKIVKRR